MPPSEVTSGVQDPAILFVLRLGHALHNSGYAAHSLEDILQKVCDRLGLVGQFFTTPTAIMASFGPLDHQQTFLIRVQPGELNLGRLSALDDVVHLVARGQADSGEGSARIDKILTKKPTYPWWLRVFGYGIVSAAGCQFLGGGRTDVEVGMARRSAHRPARAGVQAPHDHVARVRADGDLCRLGAGDVAGRDRAAHVDPDDDARRDHHAAARSDDHRRDDRTGEPPPVVRQCPTERGVHRLRIDDVRRRARHHRGDGVARWAGSRRRRDRASRPGRATSRWLSRRSALRCCCARVRATSRWCLPSAGWDM